MPNTKIVRISEEAYERLKSWAIPLEDSVSRVIERVLDVAEGRADEVDGPSRPGKHLLRSIRDVLAEEGIEVSGLAERIAAGIRRDGNKAFESTSNRTTEPYLSLEAAGNAIGLSASTLRQQIRAGRLKGTKIGRAWVTTREWLDEYQRDVQRSRKEL